MCENEKPSLSDYWLNLEILQKILFTEGLSISLLKLAYEDSRFVQNQLTGRNSITGTEILFLKNCIEALFESL